MKPTKIARAFLILILIVVVSLLVVVFFADHLTKVAVEKSGRAALGVPTTLKSADLSLLSGSLGLQGLVIDNPPGFQTDQLLAVKECFTRVDLDSILTDTVRVQTIKLDGLDLTIEQKGLASNVQVVMDYIKSHQQSSSPQTTSTKGSSAGKKIQVDRIEITHAVARVKLLPLPGRKDVVEIKLAPIILENISSGENQAVLAATVIQKVMVALVGAVIETGGDLIPADLTKGLNASLQEVGKLIGSVSRTIENVGKTLQQGGQTLQQTGQDILKVFDTPPDSSKKPSAQKH